MKVGFVLECGPDGADYKVINHLVLKLRPTCQPRFVYSGSKRALFDECEKHVAGLFDAERCERVFVVWDLVPCDDIFKDKGSPCRKKERSHLLGALRAKDRARTILLCIRHELEAWLLADGTALTALLGRKNHPKRTVPDDKKPENHPNPKKNLSKIFNDHGRGDYVDRVHAVKIIEKVNLSKLGSAPSFARLKEKLEGL